jgi:hypothetical protein
LRDTSLIQRANVLRQLENTALGDNNMIYIISGTSRSGKTFLAQKIMKKRGIPYLSLDWLVMGFTNGIPEYGIHDKLWPYEIAERLWDYLKAMLESIIWSESDIVIEGEAVLPELIINFLKKHPSRIRVCFLGYAHVSVPQKVEEVYEYHRGKKDWLTTESMQNVEDHIRNMVAYSDRIEKTCSLYGLRYFDTSRNFTQALDQAMEYLLKEK